MNLVLDYLGVATSPEAIVEAMRRRPKRRKKERGEIALQSFRLHRRTNASECLRASRKVQLWRH
jgi:hypothetical protein